MRVKCPVCGAPLEEGRCSYCGFADEPEVQAAENASAPAGQPAAGQQTVGQQTQIFNTVVMGGEEVPRKSKMVALLLCIFLGYLGIHRFYVGKSGTGLLYLFTVGVCGIGWIIDIILIATGAFRDSAGLPLQ